MSRFVHWHEHAGARAHDADDVLTVSTSSARRAGRGRRWIAHVQRNGGAVGCQQAQQGGGILEHYCGEQVGLVGWGVSSTRSSGELGQPAGRPTTTTAQRARDLSCLHMYSYLLLMLMVCIYEYSTCTAVHVRMRNSIVQLYSYSCTARPTTVRVQLWSLLGKLIPSEKVSSTLR